MSNMMNRSFSKREKYLLLFMVLVLVVGLYFGLVHYPIASRNLEITDETDEALFQTDVANARLENYNVMKKELDEVFAMPEDEITVMPEYDNLQTLMNYFNVIFAGTGQDLGFDGVRINDNNVAERTVRFSFTAQNYDHAYEILDKLTNSGYRCLLDSLTFGPSGGNVETGMLRVSGAITFYERNAE